MIPRPECLDGLPPALGIYLAALAAFVAVPLYYLHRLFRGPRPRP